MQVARFFSALALCTLSTLGLLGCGDDDDDREPHVDIPCDIRDNYCRRAIFRLTAQVRGQAGAKLPPSRIITRQQFATETRNALDDNMRSRDALLFEETLRLLKFLPPNSSIGEAMAEANIGGVAAYYDPNTADITIIDDSAESVSSGSLTLSHEYTHSLQDQREGLAALYVGALSTDAQMAVSALLEGEATILSDVAMSRAAGLPYLRDDVLAYLDRLTSALLSDIETSVAPFNQAQLVLPYPVGGRAIAEAYLARNIAGVRAYYAARPRTLNAWVQFDKNLTLPVALTCTRPDAPAGHDVIGTDSLGFTALLALFVKLGLTGLAPYDAARSWANDSYAIFGEPGSTSAAAVAWRIRLSDEAAASALEAQLRASTLGIAVSRSGSELVLSAASKPEVLSAWTGRNLCSTQKSRDEPRSLLPSLGRLPQRALGALFTR